MSASDETQDAKLARIDALIEASSLGTPAARSLRNRTSPEFAADLVTAARLAKTAKQSPPATSREDTQPGPEGVLPSDPESSVTLMDRVARSAGGAGGGVGGVFINYRSTDQPLGAAAIHDQLSRRFGADRVFRDCVSMQPGEHYPTELRKALDEADILVVVVGPEWLTCTDANGRRRIDNDHDWVRGEIARAFARSIPVVPVLLQDTPAGTRPLDARELPADIAQLALIQSFNFSQLRFGADMQSLIARILKLVPALGISQLFTGPPPLRHADSAPSTLLRAEYAIVDFHGRERELDQLRSWATGPQVCAATLVTGPAGSGKTRLALALCDSLKADGWLVGFVSEQAPDVDITNTPHVDKPLLVVVDDVASRVDQLVALTTAVGERSAQRVAPIRILLLSRTDGDWLAALKNHRTRPVAGLFQPITEQSTITLDTGTRDPGRQFTTARAAFASALRVPADGVISYLHSNDESVLTIHAAALTSLLLPVEHAGQHSLRLLMRRVDRGHVRRVAGARQLVAAHIATIATVATLCRPRSDESAKLAAFLGDDSDRLDDYVNLYRLLYPGHHALSPLRPDPAGHEVVATTLKNDPSIITTLAAAGSDEHLVNAFIVLAQALPRHPDLAEAVVTLIQQEPDRLVLRAIDAAAQVEQPDKFLQHLGTTLLNTATQLSRAGLFAVLDSAKRQLSAPARTLLLVAAAQESATHTKPNSYSRKSYEWIAFQLFEDIMERRVSERVLSDSATPADVLPIALRVQWRQSKLNIKTPIDLSMRVVGTLRRRWIG